MNRFTSKMTGSLAILVGITSILAVVTLVLFFLGFFQNISSLTFLGGVNDVINALAASLSAVLASMLYPAMRQGTPRLSLVLLIGTWMGALAVAFGSWLIITDRSGVELSSYYFFFGNGLIGIWLWVLNRLARQQAAWPRALTGFGLIASVFMMVGLLGLYGILIQSDGNDYSPLVMSAGISFLGTGILYPVWCLWLGRWILSKQHESAALSGVSR